MDDKTHDQQVVNHPLKSFIIQNQSPHEPSLENSGRYHISVDEELWQVLIALFLLGNQWEESVHHEMQKSFFHLS